MADDLLSMFMSMGTSDHEQLVQQFCTVIPGCPQEQAEFFLEANAWSLQAAVCSLMDQGGQEMMFAQATVPEAVLVCDVTIGEGEQIPPGVQFEKTWRLQNSGQVRWPDGCMLCFCQGDQMGGGSYVQVPAINPGEMTDVSVTLKAPTQTGNYWGSWKLRTEAAYAELEIFVVIEIAEGGMLDTLQQMHASSITPGAAAIFSPHQEQQAQPAASGFGGGFAAGGGFGAPAGSGFGGQPAAQPAAAGQFGIPSFGSLSTHSFGTAPALGSGGFPAPQQSAFGQAPSSAFGVQPQADDGSME